MTIKLVHNDDFSFGATTGQFRHWEVTENAQLPRACALNSLGDLHPISGSNRKFSYIGVFDCDICQPHVVAYFF